MGLSPNHLPEHVEQAVISCDGVKEFNSGGQTLEVLCVQFPPCHQVYHVCIWKKDKPLLHVEDAEVDELEPLRELIDDVIEELPNQVKRMCNDAPKRSKCRGQKAPTGYHSCDYCEAAGELYMLPSGKKQVRWPFRPTSYDAQLRTNERARNTENPPPGIIARSPLLKLDSDKFDMVHDMPADQMHTVAGVVKRLFEMSFTLKNASTGHAPPIGIRRIPEERLKGITWNILVSDMRCICLTF